MELMKQQRHFLQLFAQTTPAQRKALLQTITGNQLRSLSQISRNIIKFTIRLTPSEKTKLKRQRRIVHTLGNKTIGLDRKKRIVLKKQLIVYTLIKIALTYLDPVL